MNPHNITTPLSVRSLTLMSGTAKSFQDFEFLNDNNNDINPDFEVGPNLTNKVNVDPVKMQLTKDGEVRCKFNLSTQPKKADPGDIVEFDIGYMYVPDSVDMTRISDLSEAETRVVINEHDIVKIDRHNEPVEDSSCLTVKFNKEYDKREIQYVSQKDDAMALVSFFIAEKDRVEL